MEMGDEKCRGGVIDSHGSGGGGDDGGGGRCYWAGLTLAGG